MKREDVLNKDERKYRELERNIEEVNEIHKNSIIEMNKNYEVAMEVGDILNIIDIYDLSQDSMIEDEYGYKWKRYKSQWMLQGMLSTEFLDEYYPLSSLVKIKFELIKKGMED